MLHYKVFEAETIEFVGSVHYSDDELKKYIFGSRYVNVLYYKMFGKKDNKIPFIQKYDVETDWLISCMLQYTKRL